MTMKFWIIALMLAVAASADEVAPNLVEEITLDLSQSRAHKGENISMICRVTNMQEGDNIYWFKTIYHPDGEDHLDQIATNDLIQLPYIKFSNYHLSKYSSGSTHYFTLAIYDVGVQETGSYICSYLELDENIYDQDTFEVYQSAEYAHVYLNASGEEIDKDVGIEALAGETLFLMIEVGDAVPAAHMTVYIGDEDVTANFTMSHETDVRCEGDSLKDCPLHFTQRTIATSRTFAFKPEHRDYEMLISTMVPGSGLEPVNSTVALTISYEPQFRCLKEWSLRVGGEITLACKVRAYPKPELFYWLIPNDGENMTMDASEEMQHGNYTVDSEYLGDDDEEPEENTFLVALKISYVGPDDFMSYYLMAGNEHGNNTLEFNLIEDTSPTAVAAAPPAIVINTLAMLCAALLATMYTEL